MNTVWEILYARQMALHYAAPPICEVVFSGSSSPIIVLSEPAIGRVTGLVLGGVGGFDLSWNAFPGALCYNVYFIGGDSIAVPLAQCVTDPFFPLPPNLGPGEVVVTPITLEGEGPPSDPIPYPTAGTFTLTIMSDPEAGVPFSLGPFDVNGAGSGVTTAAREYNPGQMVSVTAELTHNYAAFEKWQLGGVDYSENLTTSVLMNANYTLTAIYSCDGVGTDLPATFMTAGPTSLGIFSVPPGSSSVLISGAAEASSYDIYYRGGSIKTINPLDCAGYMLPPGCLLAYNGGANNTDVSDSPVVDDNCVVDQPTLESLFPLNNLFQFAHVGGSMSLQWNATVFLNGVELPIEDFECGDACPQWEVIQESGLITQPNSWRIRDYADWILEALPIAKLDAGDAGCTDFTSANYPLEMDPNAVEWQGTSVEGFVQTRIYDAISYVDSMDFFITPGPAFDPIKMNGFEGGFAQVIGPRTKAQTEADLAGYVLDAWPVTSPVDRYWVFWIWGGGITNPIWAGIKAVGDTPIGSYQRIYSACPASAPQCMYLENGPT